MADNIMNVNKKRIPFTIFIITMVWPGQHGKDDCVALGAKYYYTTGQGKDKFGGGKFHEWQLVDWMNDSPCPEYRWDYSRNM